MVYYRLKIALRPAGKTVLVDPWLAGTLSFAGQNWAFEGRKGLKKSLDVDAIAQGADLLLLSQV